MILPSSLSRKAKGAAGRDPAGGEIPMMVPASTYSIGCPDSQGSSVKCGCKTKAIFRSKSVLLLEMDLLKRDGVNMWRAVIVVGIVFALLAYACIVVGARSEDNRAGGN